MILTVHCDGFCRRIISTTTSRVGCTDTASAWPLPSGMLSSERFLQPRTLSTKAQWLPARLWWNPPLQRGTTASTAHSTTIILRNEGDCDPKSQKHATSELVYVCSIRSVRAPLECFWNLAPHLPYHHPNDYSNALAFRWPSLAHRLLTAPPGLRMVYHIADARWTKFWPALDAVFSSGLLYEVETFCEENDLKLNPHHRTVYIV